MSGCKGCAAAFVDGTDATPRGSIWQTNRLYYRAESDTVLLIEPSAKEYVERGRFTQPDRSRSPAWAHPVIANGKLYIRDQDVLLCYDVKAKQWESEYCGGRRTWTSHA
jgi:hypothetical protein